MKDLWAQMAPDRIVDSVAENRSKGQQKEQQSNVERSGRSQGPQREQQRVTWQKGCHH